MSTNKYDVELARIRSKTAMTAKIADTMVRVVLVAVICYTAIKLMSFPADNIRALADVAAVVTDNKMLAVSMTVNLILLVAWIIVFQDNQKLRKERQ